MTKIMLVAITAISITSLAVLPSLGPSDSLSTFSWNPFVEEKKMAGVIETAHGSFAVPGYLGVVEASSVADTFFLTDEPGNWFKSETGGLIPTLLGSPDPVRTPLTIIQPGQAVEFDLKTETDAKHTVSLLVPATDLLTIDQSRADDDKVAVQFDESGVHLFACKVHPYMSGIVVVLEPGPDGISGTADDVVPDVTASDLPFIARAGAPALPATLVASILTNVAPLDDKPTADPLGIALDKESKWTILSSSDSFGGIPVGAAAATAGVGEVWVNTQFEKVTGQTTVTGEKPGSITVVDVGTTSFIPTVELNALTNFAGGAQGPDALGNFNNPHNMWTDVTHSVIYNGNWFGQWLNLIDKPTGTITDSITVGFAPTHIVTIPDETSDEFGILTLPLSAERDILKIEDDDGSLQIQEAILTGSRPNHPHGQWITSSGDKILIPNVFQGVGPGLPGIAGSVTIMDAESGNIIREITTADVDGGALFLPVAVGIKGDDKGYVANIGTGTVSVVDLTSNSIINNIQVACFNPVLIGGDGTCGSAPLPKEDLVLGTLKLPIQTPASPDGKFVVTAVFSLVSGINPDTIAVIDTSADGGKGALVAELPCPAGCHGVNWGAKLGGGYYAYVTSQHANVMTVVDPKSGPDAAIVAVVPLGDPSVDVTDGTGGQGVLPLPLVSNGWVQDTVEACSAVPSPCTTEVNDWLATLTDAQKFT